MKLLEAKQAVEFAQTDLDYRKVRIASLLQSLEDETIENFNPSSPMRSEYVPLPTFERRINARDTGTDPVSSE